MSGERVKFLLGNIVLLSLLFQGSIFVANDVPDWDEAVYFDVSRNLAHTGMPIRSYDEGVIFFQHPPLSFAFFAVPFLLGFERLAGIRFVSTIFSIALIILVFVIGRRVQGECVGLIAAFLTAINPLFLAYAHSVYMETILSFFIILSVLLFLSAMDKERGLFYFLSGVSLGLGLLTKYLAIITLVPCILFLFFKYDRKLLRQTEIYLLIIPALGLFSLWPFLGLCWEWDEFWANLQRWIFFSRGNLHDYRVGMSLTTYLKWIMGSISPPFILLFCLSFVVIVYSEYRNRRHHFAELFIVAFASIWFSFLFIVVSIKDIKYVVPIVPIMALTIAIGIEALLSASFGVSSKWNRKFGVYASFLIVPVLLWLLWSDVSFASRTPLVGKFYARTPFIRRSTPSDTALWEVGDYIRHISNSDEVITVNLTGPIIGYLAGRNYCFLVTSQYQEMMRDLEKTRILVQDGEWSLPYLSEEQRDYFLATVASEFELAKTVHCKGEQCPIRIYIKRAGVRLNHCKEISLDGPTGNTIK